MNLKRKNNVEEDDLTFENDDYSKVIEEDLPEEDMDDTSDILDDDFGDYGDGGLEVPLNKHGDLLKNLTNFDPYLKESFNNWLGLSWSEEEKKFVTNPLIKPIMNIKGATWCNGLLKTYTRGNNIITNIRGAEYKNLMHDHIEAIWLNLGTRDDLGIKEDGDLLRVANEMEHATALVLMGAGDGKYNQFLGSTYSYHGSAAENVNSLGLTPRSPIVKKSSPLQRLKNALIGEQ